MPLLSHLGASFRVLTLGTSWPDVTTAVSQAWPAHICWSLQMQPHTRARLKTMSLKCPLMVFPRVHHGRDSQTHQLPQKAEPKVLTPICATATQSCAKEWPLHRLRFESLHFSEGKAPSLHLTYMGKRGPTPSLEDSIPLTCNCCFSRISQSLLVMDAGRLSWAVVLSCPSSGASGSSLPALQVTDMHWYRCGETDTLRSTCT